MKANRYTTSAMKAFLILLNLSIMSGFALENVNAKSPLKLDYQKVNRITSTHVDSTLSKLSGKIIIPEFGIDNTLNCKLEILTLHPKFATSGHNSHSKKKIKPYISDKSNVYDKWWYRLAAGLFNVNMNSRYPSRTVPTK
jgi:hypothetical protein